MFDILDYQLTKNGMYVVVFQTTSNSIYYYYETFGSIDIRDEKGNLVGGDIYNQIFDYLMDGMNQLINELKKG